MGRKLPERFTVKADSEYPCDGCGKSRKGCQYCNRCHNCCRCQICDLCNGAPIGHWSWEAMKATNLEVCRCEYCGECGKKTQGEDLCVLGEDDNKRYCESCINKLEQIKP